MLSPPPVRASAVQKVAGVLSDFTAPWLAWINELWLAVKELQSSSGGSSNLDGGSASSVYGGTSPVDGGGA